MEQWNRDRARQPDQHDTDKGSAGLDAKSRREREAERKEKLDEALDQGLEDSFPGSDPVSVVQPSASPYDKDKS
jgi:hypothetical protein